MAAGKDMNLVISYIRADLKTKLDSARHTQTTGAQINLGSDPVLSGAQRLIGDVILDFAEINKRTEQLKTQSRKMKNATLTADEIYQIDMDAIKDIKKAGLNRELTKDERTMLKNAARRFNTLYSEQIKAYKLREKQIR